MISRSVILFILLLALPTWGQEWKLLTESNGRNGEKVFWDGKLDGDGKDRLMLIKFVPKGKSKLLKPNEYIVQRWVLHCGSKRMSVTKSLTYDKAGNLTKSRENPVKRVELVPGSTAEEVYGIVCLEG